jgi:CRISPR-associated protein Cmr5
MTRQQRYLRRALDDVRTVSGQPEVVRKVYGGFWHALAVLVRTCGLCQTVAFIEAKQSGESDRPQAFRLVRDHIAGILDVAESRLLLDSVRGWETLEYMRRTRSVLEAAVYYKRFAESILKVLPGEHRDGDRA